MSTSQTDRNDRIRVALAGEVIKARADRVAQRDYELRPLSQHARPAFTARGTCSVCGAVDVCGRLNSTHQIVCASCTMSGRG